MNAFSATTAQENEHARELREAIEKQAEERISLEQMRGWVDEFQSNYRARMLAERKHQTAFDSFEVWMCAVGCKLMDFLEQCEGSREEIWTVFRAKAHRQRWQKRKVS